MARGPEETPRPATPLAGYQDTGAEVARWSRRSVVRAWIILAVIALLYLGWTLTVYFLEPGLR
jgi:uncharacterized membrane protein YdfJ with MMPL/SSD domain